MHHCKRALTGMCLVLPGCIGPGSTGNGPLTPTPTTSQAPPVTSGTAVEVTESGPITCADPSLRDAEKMVTVQSRAEPDKKAWFWGGGVIVADLDGDGVLDVMLPGFWETMLYLGTPSGVFEEASERLSALPTDQASGGSAADYDGDGDLDVVLTRFLAPDVLLNNQGDGTFVDVSADAGLLDIDGRSMATSWGDLDRDGDLDLFVGGYGAIDQSEADPSHTTFAPAEPSQLYINQGDGSFVDIGPTLPAEVHDGYTLGGGFHDLDRDGWSDLYVMNDFGQSYPSRLMWNQQGTLSLDGGASGLDVALTGMGVAIGDADQDGIDDVVISAWDEIGVLMSGAGASWFDWSKQLGIVNDKSRGQKIAWGVDFADMDNDGDLDVPLSYGFLDSVYPAQERQPDAMYLRGDDGTYVDVAPQWVIHHPTVGRGFVPVDLNDDGYIDLVRRDLYGPTLLSTSRCGNGAWLRLRLHQDGMNPDAIGARVVVTADAGVQTRTVLAGGTNHASGGPPEVHFGLAEAATVDVVEVTWPDGEVSRLTDLQARQIVDITRRD